MGQDFAQRREWNENVGLDWDLLQYGPHKGVNDLVRDLNHLYRDRPALHARDCEGDGFEWLVVDDSANAVFAWARHAPDANPIAIVINMTPVERSGYELPLPRPGFWSEILNTDAARFGGDNRGNLGGVTAEADGRGGKPAHARLTIPPLATVYLEWTGP
jgi:1,4-alpha-glucan branching enzyme